MNIVNFDVRNVELKELTETLQNWPSFKYLAKKAVTMEVKGIKCSFNDFIEDMAFVKIYFPKDVMSRFKKGASLVVKDVYFAYIEDRNVIAQVEQTYNSKAVVTFWYLEEV